MVVVMGVILPTWGVFAAEANGSRDAMQREKNPCGTNSNTYSRSSSLLLCADALLRVVVIGVHICSSVSGGDSGK